MPFSTLYFLITRIKQILTSPIKLPIPIICIGNITVGGTGKTQMALYIARYLHNKGVKICIVSKGYGRKSCITELVDLNIHTIQDVGDEAFMLAKYFPVIIYKDINIAGVLLKQHGFDLAIFDDAMQNNSFIKDFTILMIDGLRGFGNKRLLPAGPLREFMTNITKADIAIMVGEDNHNALPLLNIPVYKSKIVANTKLDTDVNYFAFSGIGNPDKFFLSLNELGLNIIETQSFPDHYNYSREEVEQLYLTANNKSATLVTTEKDWVKMPKELQDKIKYLEVALFFEQENILLNLLDRFLTK